MNRQMFDWNRVGNEVFATVLLAVLTGGTPVLGIGENGDLLFAVGF